MNLEKTIQACFDYYPELFQRREQVLDQLFCTIGNGYEWVNGELISLEYKEAINSLDEEGKARQYHIITKGELEQRFLSPKDDDGEPQYTVEHMVYPLCLN